MYDIIAFDYSHEMYAVDLDGTLAHSLPGYMYEKHWRVIGKPIKPMVKQVKKWLKEGKKIVILTARMHSSESPERRRQIRNAIRQWCIEHIGQALPVTAEKHPMMVKIYDDRAVQIKQDSGKPVVQMVARRALQLSKSTKNTIRNTSRLSV